MKNIHLLIMALLPTAIALAQKPETVKIEMNQNVKEVLTNEIYRYPAFTQGKVYFKDGAPKQALLNYNRLLSEMHFLNPKGDTLAIAQPEIINFIEINQDTFYIDKAFLEMVVQNKQVKLAKKETIQLVDRQKVGAYGETNSAGAIGSFNTYTNNAQTVQLNTNEVKLYSLQTEFYIADKHNHFILVTKKNLVNLYAKQEKDLKTFLQENNTNLHNEEDLKKLVLHLN
jgi:hypothetical protein